jgi:hypothetical protein
VSVNHGHSIRRRAAQLSGAGETAKTGADDDDVLLWWRFTPLERHDANLRCEALTVAFEE